MASQTWCQDLAANYTVPVTVSGTTSKTAMITDVTIPAYGIALGSKFFAKLFGNITTAASTPGTITFGANWGGAGGTSICASAALSLVASATTLPFMLEYLIVCTAFSQQAGTATLFGQGWFHTTTGVFATPAHTTIPASAPAGVASLTVATAQALDFSVTFSSSTTNALTTNLFTLLSTSF